MSSLKGLYYGFRAKWHIFDVGLQDTGPSNRLACQMNLWHGIPLKDITCLKPDKIISSVPISWMKQLLWRILPPPIEEINRRYFIHPNIEFRHHILDSFVLKEENVILANLPRNIVFEKSFPEDKYLTENDRKQLLPIRKLRSQGSKIIGYFPTWRGDGQDLFMGTTDRAVIESLNRFMIDNDCYLVTKWHACVDPAYEHKGRSEVAFKLIDVLKKQSNFVVLNFDSDLNSYLTTCGMLITDYSSVFFDYLLCDRPIIFMAYDLAKYRDSWGFLFDYESFVPGPICNDIESIKQALFDFVNNPDDFSERFHQKRDDVRRTVFDTTDSCDKIIAVMNSIDQDRYTSSKSERSDNGVVQTLVKNRR